MYAGYIPFQAQSGKLIENASHAKGNPNVDWKPNKIFSAKLTFSYVVRRRSTKYVLTDKKGREYPMFSADMIDVLMNAWINKGSVDGYWSYIKRGSFYGVRFHR